MIAEARAQVPGNLGSAGLRLTQAEVTQGRDGAAVLLRLVGTGQALHAPDVFVDGLTNGSPRHPRLDLAGDGGIATLTVPIIDAKASAIAGKPLVFVLVDGARSAEFQATPILGPLPSLAACTACAHRTVSP